MIDPNVAKATPQGEQAGFTDMNLEGQRLWVKSIVDRLMRAWGFKNKKQLADALSLNAKAPSNWIQNASIPWSAIVVCSAQTGKSLDWLYYGNEPVLQLSEKTHELLKQRIEAFLQLSCKAKQIKEANINGLATLADGLSDDIKAFLLKYGEVGHDLPPQ